MKKQKNTDYLLRQRYAPVADGIVLLFSGYVEVIIHDIESQSIVYIANNISKRKLGDDSALDDTEFPSTEKTIGPYEKINWDGQKIRSTSIILRDDSDEPIGMLCINMLVSNFEAARDMLNLMLEGNKSIPQPEKLFHDDWQERINLYVNTWLKDKQLTIAVLTHNHKRQLIHELYKEGAFNGKSASDYIANILSMGRATVFKYLSEIKKK